MKESPAYAYSLSTGGFSKHLFVELNLEFIPSLDPRYVDLRKHLRHPSFRGFALLVQLSCRKQIIWSRQMSFIFLLSFPSTQSRKLLKAWFLASQLVHLKPFFQTHPVLVATTNNESDHISQGS